MTTEEWDVQDSLTLGQGRTPGLMTNIRSTFAAGEELAEKLLAMGMARIPAVRALEAEWAASAPQPPAPQRAPEATQAPSYDQGVANAQAGLGGQVVQQSTTAPGQPQNGAAYPGRFCECGAGRIVAAGIGRTTNKPFYRLDCANDPKGHKPDWSLNPR
jgi:hypothetical protein